MSTKSQDSRQICSKYVFFKVKRGTINKKKDCTSSNKILMVKIKLVTMSFYFSK